MLYKNSGGRKENGLRCSNILLDLCNAACLVPGAGAADTREIFADSLPAIPLYFNISAAVSATNICGMSDKIGSRSVLWNMEQFSRAESPCAVSQWNNIYQ